MSTIYTWCEFPGFKPESIPFDGSIPRVGDTFEATLHGPWRVREVVWCIGPPTLRFDPHPSNELALLRAKQAHAASAAAGPLLDAWEAMGEDTRDDPLLAEVATAMADLREAMEGS